MSRKYMDFVPAKSVDGKSTVVSGAPKRVNVVSTARVATARTTTVTKPRVLMPEPTATPRTRMMRRDTSRQMVNQNMAEVQPVMRQRTVTAQKTVVSRKPAAQFTIRNEMKLGEIEDLNPKFVNMDVPKRPLGEGLEHRVPMQQANSEKEVKEVKSKRLIGRLRNKSNAKSSPKSEKKIQGASETFAAPRPTFINQDKVVKRPLSKNVYQKQITPNEGRANKGPVAIIAKPEKESKAGLVVAIILTIILGAVAGTVAFLLLPK